MRIRENELGSERMVLFYFIFFFSKRSCACMYWYSCDNCKIGRHVCTYMYAERGKLLCTYVYTSLV